METGGSGGADASGEEKKIITAICWPRTLQLQGRWGVACFPFFLVLTPPGTQHIYTGPGNSEG
jgi:hypothetical protein